MSKRNKPYFNMNIEDEKKIHQAVCFSPSKKRLFDEAHITDKGVSISDARFGADGTTLLINDSTKIREEKLGFLPNNEIATQTIKKIINEVPVKTKVNVHGKLLLEESKHVKVNGQDVPIRNGYICDPTGYVKITLWREYTSLVHEMTYTFISLVKTTFDNVCQLQTCQSTSHKQVADLLKYEAPCENLHTETKNSCRIIGLVFAHKVVCLFCREKE